MKDKTPGKQERTVPHKEMKDKTPSKQERTVPHKGDEGQNTR